MQKLEKFHNPGESRTGQIVSEVDDKVPAAPKMGIKVGWIDKVLGKIVAKGNHYTLIRKAKY